MNRTFKDFYVNSLIRESSNEPPFDGSDDWFEQHRSSTKKRSLAIGIVQESFGDWRNFVDINVMFPIFKLIRESDKSLVYLTRHTTIEEYILETIKRKFKDNDIEPRTINNSIVKEIRLVESQDKIAIVTPDNTTVYTLKNLIEYI